MLHKERMREMFVIANENTKFPSCSFTAEEQDNNKIVDKQKTKYFIYFTLYKLYPNDKLRTLTFPFK